jgi:hypothetical protein
MHQGAFNYGRHRICQIMTLQNPLFFPDRSYAQFIFPADFAGQGVLNKDPTVWLRILSQIMTLPKS